MKGTILRIILSLVIVAALAIGGYSLYRAGWSKGFVSGQMAEAAANTAGQAPEGNPFPPAYYYPPRPGLTPYGSGLALFAGILLFLFAITTISKWMRFEAMRTMAGPGGKFWTQRWHRHHGSIPPWMKHCTETNQEQDAQQESESQKE